MSWDHISSGSSRARKEHICDWCGQTIVKGEVCCWFVGKCVSDFQHTKLHAECDMAMKRDMRALLSADNYQFVPCVNPRGRTEEEAKTESGPHGAF